MQLYISKHRYKPQYTAHILIKLKIKQINIGAQCWKLGIDTHHIKQFKILTDLGTSHIAATSFIQS